MFERGTCICSGISLTPSMLLGLGYERVKNYAGSWIEWANNPILPIINAAGQLEIPVRGAKKISQHSNVLDEGMMGRFGRLKNQFLSRLAARFPSLAQRFVDGYQPQEVAGEIPWVEPGKPLRQARVAMVTTSGIHHREQALFDMDDKDGDPSYRTLDAGRLFADFQITHDYYDHTDARKDPNIIFPLERLNELVNEGVIGSLAEKHYSFMGHIDGRHIKTLVEKTAREVAGKLKADNVDLVLLTPA